MDLDTAQKLYEWLRLNQKEINLQLECKDVFKLRVQYWSLSSGSLYLYATAGARSDGMFLLCGGRGHFRRGRT
ncbi:putative protein-serine/threonine phosphatase [Helianthus annuus]|nr:putative protein-serine/threonine phosphatase [Helianthus annuus]